MVDSRPDFIRKAGSGLLASLLLLASASTVAAQVAQEEVEAVLRGRLLLSNVPADSGTVVLHRVTPELAGGIDSTVVSPDGSFSIRLPNMPVPGSNEIFFGSTRRNGVLYAGASIVNPVQLDSTYVIRAYPSEPAPEGGTGFRVTQRELWLDQSPVGWQVTDVIAIQNPTDVTLTAASDSDVVWRYPLPSGAISPRILQMAPNVGPASIEDGWIRAGNPIVPGENYFIMQYEIETIEIDVPMPGPTDLIQLLLRAPAPEVRVEGLARQPDEPIEQGATFLRWAGESMSDQVVSVRLGSDSAISPVIWLTLALAMLLIGAGAWVVQRRPGPATRGVPVSRPANARASEGRLRRDVLVEIARLDEEFGAIESPSGHIEDRYRHQRARLLGELHGAKGS